MCWLHVENPSAVSKNKDVTFTHYLPISYTTLVHQADSVFASGGGWGYASRVFTTVDLTAVSLGVTTTSGGSLNAGGAAGGVITIGY